MRFGSVVNIDLKCLNAGNSNVHSESAGHEDRTWAVADGLAPGPKRASSCRMVRNDTNKIEIVKTAELTWACMVPLWHDEFFGGWLNIFALKKTRKISLTSRLLAMRIGQHYNQNKRSYKFTHPKFGGKMCACSWMNAQKFLEIQMNGKNK